jgi:hypothetical protein
VAYLAGSTGGAAAGGYHYTTGYGGAAAGGYHYSSGTAGGTAYRGGYAYVR